MAEQRERDRDVDRLLTFVDAVVAIAITLLVLPLVDVARELGPDESVAHLLEEHVRELIAFALSFAVIARLWFVQHALVRDLVAADAAVTRFLVLWLFSIVLLPFPTSLVAEAGEQPGIKVFYVATMVVSTLFLSGIAWAVARNRGLRDSDRAPAPFFALVTASLFVLALLLMLVLPWLSYWPMLLVALDDPLVGAWRRWRGR
ncbi:DUF1211 domain-containing membrane protein [Marmoricola endophyticus]|uniref:DUF1211 domain-containing membrane protein n=1 Tax=Marmoricola endophyticus TaxID=2040280 RepID=A0A917BCC1_9ACTN|nr:TMEM175 family protein [Marmoricola endophyticus]GGF37280.1 DUF1211 domain-containing membrane protein [Marmoricola endophyticus]